LAISTLASEKGLITIIGVTESKKPTNKRGVSTPPTLPTP